MEENDLTTTAKALINVNTRLEKVEKGGSSTGGGTTPTDSSVPDSGVNVDPGKSLTGQTEVWSGSTKEDAEDQLTLDSSINKNLDNVGDGLQFVFKIVKTPITSGAQGTPVDLMPIATTSTTPVSGKYVCSVPVPISIKKGSFAVGTTLTVKLDGIGEGLNGVAVSMAPEVQLTFNNDGTISVKPIQGYAFDKLTSGNTGAYYDVIITSVTTYTVTAPVVPLANGTLLWSGNATVGESIGLDTKLKPDFSNVGDGLAITTGDTWTFSGWKDPNAQVNSGKFKAVIYRVAKADLVRGKTVTVAPYQGIDNVEGTAINASKADTPHLIMSKTPSIEVTVAPNGLTITTGADGKTIEHNQTFDGSYEDPITLTNVQASFAQVSTYYG